jgi:hypothetical protein
MDPISIVGHSTSLVSQSIQIVRILTDVTQAFKDESLLPAQPDELERVRVYVDASLLKLEQWQQIWQLDSKILSRSDIENSLWGQDGWSAISRLIAAIRDNCQEIIDMLPLKASGRYTNSSKPLRRWASIIRPKRRRKAHIDLKRLRFLITHLNDDLDALTTISNLHFHARHDQEPSIFSVKTEDGLLGEALNNIHQSISLYAACVKHRINIQLDIDLFCDDIEQGPRRSFDVGRTSGKSYHFYFTSATQEPQELLLSPLLDNEFSILKCRESKVYKTRDLLQALTSNTNSDKIFCLRDVSGSQVLYYRIEVPCNPVTACHEPLPLANLFDYNAKTVKDGILLTLRERLGLAYKIAEFGLYHLGTPWLSNLNSRTLKSWTSQNAEQRYVMQVTTENPRDICSNGIRASVRQQLFQLGVLLLEVALGTHISAVQFQSPETQAQNIVRVAREMGNDYRKACEFCLYSGEDLALQPTDAVTEEASTKKGESMAERIDIRIPVPQTVEQTALTTTEESFSESRQEDEVTSEHDDLKPATEDIPLKSSTTEFESILYQYHLMVFTPYVFCIPFGFWRLTDFSLDELYQAVVRGT